MLMSCKTNKWSTTCITNKDQKQMIFIMTTFISNCSKTYLYTKIKKPHLRIL